MCVWQQFKTFTKFSALKFSVKRYKFDRNTYLRTPSSVEDSNLLYLIYDLCSSSDKESGMSSTWFVPLVKLFLLYTMMARNVAGYTRRARACIRVRRKSEFKTCYDVSVKMRRQCVFVFYFVRLLASNSLLRASYFFGYFETRCHTSLDTLNPGSFSSLIRCIINYALRTLSSQHMSIPDKLLAIYRLNNLVFIFRK